MGALRRLPAAPRRALLAFGVVAAAGAGLAGCDPVEGNMSTSAVAITTDKTATRELERQHAKVDWLTCHASYVGKDKEAGDSDEKRKAEVDCRGQTAEDKVITVRGRVTDVTNGACVRGNLTAKIDGEEWFRVDVLGNCDRDKDDSDQGGQDDGNQHDDSRDDGDQGGQRDGGQDNGGQDRGDQDNSGQDDQHDGNQDDGDQHDGNQHDGDQDGSRQDDGNGNGDDGHDDGGKDERADNAGHDESDPAPTATVTVTAGPGQESGK
ncbi:hypothetical protein GPA10_06260 [Streptomyces sp. p1417]|uniref:Lipoprotein n=1 Tax=Streptomyces typhae TaxID=2681492 RepID=A0A6L6WS71_9ACTN|nr:hypothetical protein [Streptomyces typhae]MVO84388.1 hypothetical protein [Streptomyces typhae]